MGEWMLEYCNFLSQLYNCTYYIKDNTLFIKSNSKSNSVFKVSLNDKNLAYYTLFHKNAYKIKESYHVQYRNKNFKKVIFSAMVHDFYKENNLFYNDEDFYRTITDVTRFITNRDLEQKYKKIKYITCPICNRKINIISSGGGIRKYLHCRCKINNTHTYIKYVYNQGYYLMYRNEYDKRDRKLSYKPI